MKNKIKIYLLLIALGIGSVSCLDKYPDDAIQAGQAIKTVDDANQAIIGIYAAFKDASLYSGRLTLLPDLVICGVGTYWLPMKILRQCMELCIPLSIVVIFC